MFDKLQKLKEKGYIPDTIFDIGAYKGTWTSSMLHIYPECKYYLFEPIEYEELQNCGLLPNVTVLNVVLNEKVEEVTWYQKKNTGDSMFKERTHHFTDCEVIKRWSVDLDSIMQNAVQESSRIFIKIDCQGAEIPILKGSKSVLEKTDFIVMEMPLFGQYNEGVGTFLDHLTFMDSIGFVPYEIVEDHCVNGFCMQIDMLFINKNHEFNAVVNQLLLS